MAVTGTVPDGLGGTITVFKLRGPLHPDLCA
jgi:hypothetical protein